MTEPNFSINFTARMLAASACDVGDVLVFDSADGIWKVATDANRTTADARSQAVALTAYGGSAVGKVSYQSSGILAASISDLDTAEARQLVRVSTAGRLERIASEDIDPETDDLVGYAEPDGRVHLYMGFPFDQVVGITNNSPSPTIENDDTGVLDDIASTDGDTNASGIRFGGDAPTVAGIAGGADARTLALITTGGPLVIQNQAVTSLPENQIITGVGEDVTVPQDGGVIVRYDATSFVWRLLGSPPGNLEDLITPGGVGYAIISDDGELWTNRQLTLDDLGPAFNITMGGAQTVEVGASVATPAFTATYTGGPATSATLTDNAGSSPKSLTTPFTSVSSDGTFSQSTNNSTYTFTITALAGAVSDSSSVVIAWRPRVYHGAATAGTLNEAFIEALASSNLQSTRAVTYTDNATSGKYLYYAAPSSYGTPTFTVGGFESGIGLAASGVSVTNAHGVTQNYDIWVSDHPDLGSTTVVVT
jgi:hypothetical protein